MKECYEISCPYCDKDLECTPSIFHQMGLNDLGGGSCPACGNLFKIVYKQETDRMETRRNEKVSN